MIRRIRQRLAGESGASLILVLALMTFLGVVVGALLSYSQGSLKLTVKTYERVKVGNDAGGALQTAINQVRNTTYNNDGGQSCPMLSYPGQTGSIPVTCVAATGSGGTPPAAPITSDNFPDRGLTTLSTSSAEVGIDSYSPIGVTTRIKGGLWSNSDVAVRNNTTLANTDGPAQVRRSCAVLGTFTSSPAAPQCNIGGTVLPDPAIAKPASYSQPTAGMVYRAVPTCPAAGVPTVAFEPGFYDDAAALTSLIQSCEGKTFWFKPGPGNTVGNFYFDFRNPGSHVWELKDRQSEIVGGTPKGWNPNAVPRQMPPFPGACVTPLESSTNGGVQFIVGGDSQLKLSQSNMELCAQYSPTRLPFAIYGAKTTDLDLQGPSTVKMTTGSGVNNLPDLTFDDKDNIKELDDVSAIASLVGGNNREGVTGSVTVSGYVPTQTIAAKSILISARLVVRHRDNNNSGSSLSGLTTQITPTRTGASALAVDNIPRYTDGESGGSYHTDTIDVTAKLVDEIYNYGFAGMSVKYLASVAKNNTVTEHLDTIQLQLTWSPWTVRAQSGCVITVGGCPFIDTKQNHGSLYVHGTIYAPSGAIDLTTDKVSAPAFEVGIIVRRIYLEEQPATGYTGPFIQLPTIPSAYQDLKVYFTATCAGVPCGTAQVTYTDVGVPVSGSRAVNVLSWNVVPH